MPCLKSVLLLIYVVYCFQSYLSEIEIYLPCQSPPWKPPKSPFVYRINSNLSWGGVLTKQLFHLQVGREGIKTGPYLTLGFHFYNFEPFLLLILWNKRRQWPKYSQECFYLFIQWLFIDHSTTCRILEIQEWKDWRCPVSMELTFYWERET